MMVGERMIQDPVSVTPQDTLATARTKMQAGGFRQLPVVEDGKLVGIVTDRDIRWNRKQMMITKVNAAMTKDLVTVTPETSLEKAAQVILQHKIGGLPVVQGEKLVGIITTTDILKAFLEVMGAPG
ncbi:MAG: CBS domain-containing protein [Candidatus Binatia bacterium]